ncbi:hypothetical protein [Streptomyces sp. AC550_RSS872]|uniref:hypothetical protein n=1 Tax=Streptomyces sp. AC550_RSS872 TaxID=2823689 RepID=UPI001C27E64A|nr:hypothetical protein [Streptomyces sp. AC550_RSS872]
MKPRERRLLIALVATLLGLVAIPATALGANAGAEAHQELRQPGEILIYTLTRTGTTVTGTTA